MSVRSLPFRAHKDEAPDGVGLVQKAPEERGDTIAIGTLREQHMGEFVAMRVDRLESDHPGRTRLRVDTTRPTGPRQGRTRFSRSAVHEAG